MLTIDEGSELAEAIEATLPEFFADHPELWAANMFVLGDNNQVFSMTRGYYGQPACNTDDPVARDVGRWLRERFG